VPVGGNSPVKVCVRMISASNSNLEKLCDTGNFRRDLFYRLNVINIHLRPLRDRQEDIPLLITHFLRKHALEGQMPPVVYERALHCLISYSWPGNVRELENVIERAITLNRSGRITPEDLPPKVADTILGASRLNPAPMIWPRFSPRCRRLTRWSAVICYMEATGGNRKRVAEILGINRQCLHGWLP
jgi:DNA-binding NtrC family response regulator